MKENYEILREIKLIKQSLVAIERNGTIVGGWMHKKALMRFFDYSDNQVRILERTKAIEVSKTGRRKFYSVKSVIRLIEKNIQK